MRLDRFTMALNAGALMLPAVLAVAWGEPPSGEAIFKSKCTACHTLGEGVRVGPDLKGVAERRSADWMRRMIKDPEAMQKTDPVAKQLLAQFNNVPMTNQNLTDQEIDAVLAFLRGEPTPAATSSPETSSTTSTAPTPKAATRQRPAKLSKTALQGRDLFWGTARFHNGAPACGSCHSAGQNGLRLGGTLGPDLTGAYGKFGEDALAGILAAPPYPTMMPLYSKHPLTELEQARLLAYLKEVRGAPSLLTRPAHMAGGLVGVIGLLVLAQVVWRRRLGPVREPLTWPRRQTQSIEAVR